MDLCAGTANIGFPINVNGPISSDRISQITGDPEAYISFGTLSNPRLFEKRADLAAAPSKKWNACFINEAPTSSLTYKGLSYTLKATQICAATHSGSSWPSKPSTKNYADLIFTFTRAGFDNTYPTSFLVVVPIYQLSDVTVSTSVSSVATDYFQEILTNTDNKKSATPQSRFVAKVPNASAIFNDLKDKSAAMYLTCIALRPPPIKNEWTFKRTTLGILYFPAGFIITGDLMNKIANNNTLSFCPYVLPSESRQGYPTAIKTPPIAGTDNAKLMTFLTTGENWSSYGELAANMMEASNDRFTILFKWVPDAVAGVAQIKKKTMTVADYQCLPLDRAKDIDGKYVVLDPATGTRSLRDTMEGASQEEKDALEAAKRSGTASKTFAIVLGAIMGLILLIMGGAWIVRFILKRIDSPEGVAEVAMSMAAIAAIPNAVITEEAVVPEVPKQKPVVPEQRPVPEQKPVPEQRPVGRFPKPERQEGYQKPEGDQKQEGYQKPEGDQRQGQWQRDRFQKPQRQEGDQKPEYRFPKPQRQDDQRQGQRFPRQDRRPQQQQQQQ